MFKGTKVLCDGLPLKSHKWHLCPFKGSNITNLNGRTLLIVKADMLHIIYDLQLRLFIELSHIWVRFDYIHSFGFTVIETLSIVLKMGTKFFSSSRIFRLWILVSFIFLPLLFYSISFPYLPLFPCSLRSIPKLYQLRRMITIHNSTNDKNLF